MKDNYQTFGDYTRRLLLAAAEAESVRRYSACNSIGSHMPIDDPVEPAHWLCVLAKEGRLDTDDGMPEVERVEKYRWGELDIVTVLSKENDALRDRIEELHARMQSADEAEAKLKLWRSKLDVALDFLKRVPSESIESERASNAICTAITILRSVE